jgi:predicted NAD/FAD-binding protein
MPFENFGQPLRRIAVIGAGITGMTAAHNLAGDHAVVLFERELRLGGHARTVLAGKRGDQPVDTGFIVYNRVNYPNLVALFDKLGVPVIESDMSFGASIKGGWFEYGTATNLAFFEQKRNLIRPQFWGMFRDMLHFNNNALAASQDKGLTIGGLLDKLGTGDWFRDYYITPLSGAIWSTPTQGILDFPAEAMIRFFANHNLLGISGQHQWYTVQGGSGQYVRRLADELDRQGVEIRLGAGVMGIRREQDGVFIRAHGGEWELFDDVVLATHSDVSLAMLSDASGQERTNLGAVRYQPNTSVLHCDPCVMPKRKRVWSSWVYSEPAGARSDKIDLTYWMNSLQAIPHDDPLFVTLNPNRAIREEMIYEVNTFHHPVYDLAAVAAQEKIRATNGTANTWFAGAWMRDGFHEDGMVSALDVVGAIRLRTLARMAA